MRFNNNNAFFIIERDTESFGSSLSSEKVRKVSRRTYVWVAHCEYGVHFKYVQYFSSYSEVSKTTAKILTVQCGGGQRVQVPVLEESYFRLIKCHSQISNFKYNNKL